MEDEAEEVSDARYYVEVLENCLAEILPNLSELGEVSKDVNDSGAQLLDVLEQVKGNLGKRDVRELGGQQIIKNLLSFHEAASKLDSESNNSSCKDSLVMLVKTIRRLQKHLDKEWNSKLEDGDRALLFGDTDDPEDEPITAQVGNWHFKKACTLVHTQEFWCEDCSPPVKYTGLAFKRHKAKKHEKVVKVDLLKSTCRFPHDKKPDQRQKTRAIAKHTQDQMATHLKNCHSYEKPKDTFYRGWETYDGGLTYTPVFLEKTAPDPTGPSHPPGNNDQNILAVKTVEVDKKKAEIKGQTLEEKKHAMVVEVFGTDVTPPSSQQQALGNDDEIILQHGENDTNLVSADEDIDMDNKKKASIAPARTAFDKEESHVVNQKDEDNVQQTGNNEASSIAAETLLEIEEVVESQKQAAAPSNIVVSMETNEVESSAQDIDDELLEDNQKEEPEPQKSKKDPVIVNNAVEVEALIDNVDKNEDHTGSVDFDALLIEDEFYSSPKDGAAPTNASDSSIIKEPLIIEDDSDTEIDDTDEQTATRIANKIKRYNQRATAEELNDVCDDPKNREFIKNFTEFVVSNTRAEDDKVSTVSFSTGLLFRYPDSFLKWNVKQDPSFNLDRLVDFMDETNYLEVKDPSQWIMESEGNEEDNVSIQASRRREKYKLHARLREYIKREVNRTKFPTDVLSMMKRRMIIDNIDTLSNDISNSRAWTKLGSQVEASRRLVKNAKQVLNPGSSSNMMSANAKYFSSDEYKKRQDDCNSSFDEAMLTKSINAKPFNEMGNFYRHCVLFVDRNRNSAYQFLNKEYQAKRAAWFPPGFNKSSNFDGLPKNFNMFETPSDNRPPEAYVIKVSACNHKKLKLQADCDVVLFPQLHEMLQKYRQVKEMLFGDLKGDDPFFVTYRQKAFTAISNRPGSILSEYARINNIPGLTATTLRQTLEPYVQSSHSMSTRSKNITSHSQQVGEKFYDQTQSQFRLSSLHFVGIQEGILKEPVLEEDNETIAKKRKLEEEDTKVAKEQARETLRKTKVNRQVTLGKTCHILPQNRSFLQELFSSTGALSSLGLHKGKFPRQAKWKKEFYRVVDYSPEGLSPEDWQRIKKIEHETFLHLKESITKENGGEWMNSIEQNQHADKEVSKVIRNSFVKNQRNNPDNKKYFTF